MHNNKLTNVFLDRKFSPMQMLSENLVQMQPLVSYFFLLSAVKANVLKSVLL